MINQVANSSLALVGTSGLEPPTSRLSGARSNHLSYAPLWLFAVPSCTFGGDDGNRTHDPLLAGQVLSQLSYTPIGLGLLYSVSYWTLKIEQQVDICFLCCTALLHSSSFLFWFLFCLFANTRYLWVISHILHRKEVIQPHLPIRLPCYDLTPINKPTFDCCPLAVSPQASGVFIFHGLTGGVYKARERIHRGMLIRDY